MTWGLPPLRAAKLKAPRVTECIEDRPVSNALHQQSAAVALVEEKTGFLSIDGGDFIADAMLKDRPLLRCPHGHLEDDQTTAICDLLLDSREFGDE